jgi:hypothetical protein
MTSGNEDVDQVLNDYYDYYEQRGNLHPDPYIAQSTMISLLAGIARRLTHIEELLTGLRDSGKEPEPKDL